MVIVVLFMFPEQLIDFRWDERWHSWVEGLNIHANQVKGPKVVIIMQKILLFVGSSHRLYICKN